MKIVSRRRDIMARLRTWKPINNMVLVRKDDDKGKTEGGLILPDIAKIPVITCRVLEIGPKVDPVFCPIEPYYKVLVKPSSAVPLSFDDSNKMYVLDADHILAYEEVTDAESAEFADTLESSD